MKTMKFFKKPALLLSIVVIAALLAVAAVAGTALLANEEDTGLYGEGTPQIQVTTKGNVNLKFYYSAETTASEFVVVVTNPEGEVVDTKTLPIGELEKTSRGYCVPVLLKPSQMTYNVEVYANGADGAGESTNCSVLEYAKEVLASTDEAYADYHNDMRALLNWGAMAQVKYNEYTNALANADLYVRRTNPANGVESITVDQEGSVKYEGAFKDGVMNFSLDNPLAIHFYVVYTGEGTLSATVYREGFDAPKPTQVYSAGVDENGDTKYCVSVADVNASLFATPYTVTVTDNEGNTFTATKSVLEYLAYIVNAEKGYDSATKDTARAMYQFYQVIENVKVTDCAHGAHYWVNNGEDATLMCSVCLESLGATVSNSVENIYLPYTMGSATNYTATVSGDGSYLRLNRNVLNEDGYTYFNLHHDIGYYKENSKYVVLKIRYGLNGMATANPKGRLYCDWSASVAPSFKVVEDNEWHTIVLNMGLDSDCGEGYKPNMLHFRFWDGNDGSKNSETGVWTMYGNAEDYVDLAYVALVDSFEDVKKLIDTDTYEYALSGTQSSVRRTDDDSCVEHAVSNETVTSDENGATIYSYTCLDCGEKAFTRNVPASVTTFMSPKTLSSFSSKAQDDKITPNTAFRMNSRYFSMFGGQPAFSFKGSADGVSQYIWMRGLADKTSASTHERYFTNIGDAEYMVVKMRMSDTTVKTYLEYSTTGYDGYKGVLIPTSAAGNDVWATYVIDLSYVLSTYHAQDAEKDDYILDTFYFHIENNFGAHDSIDIAYIAFVEEGIDNIYELVDDEICYAITSASGEYTVLDTTAKKCGNHTYVRVTDEEDARGYHYECEICKTEFAFNFYSNSVGYYNPANNTEYAAKVERKTENGMTYNHVTITGTTGDMLNFVDKVYSGGMYTSVINTGRYLVIKIRGTVPEGGKLPLCVGTQDKGITPEGSNPIQVSIGNLTSASMPSDWTVMVIDLNDVAGYSVGTLQKAAFSTATGDGGYATSGVQFDLAYAIIVSDINDIKEFVKEETVNFYDASVDKTPLVIDTSDPANYCKSNGGHLGSQTMVGGVYKYVCKVCGAVIYDSGISTDEVGLLFTPKFFKDNNSGIQGKINEKEIRVDEDGMPYVHIGDCKAETYHGWTFYNSAAAPSSGRYMVMKVRRPDTSLNATKLYFWITSCKSYTGTWAAGSLEIPLAEDNEWHTIVIDLATRSSAFAANDDGSYGVRSIHMRAMGYQAHCDSVTDEQFDIAYMAFFDDLDDIDDIIKEEVYEWSYDNNTLHERYAKDHDCKTHIASGETVDGTTRSVVCLHCGDSRVISTEGVNWYSPLSGMKSMSNNLTTNLFDSDNLVYYNRYKGSSGCHFLFTGGTGAGTWTTDSYETGNYVVIKYRAEAVGTISLNVSTEDFGVNPTSTDRPYYSGIGSLQLNAMAGVGADGWRIAVVAIPDGIRYTKNSTQRIYFQMTSANSAYIFDIAYCAVIDSLDEMKSLLAEGETYYYHGTSLSNKGAQLDRNGQCVAGCSWAQSGSNVVCSGCGTVIPNATMRNNVNLADHTNYSCTNNTEAAAGYAISNQTDTETGYKYARLYANPESTSKELRGLNLIGGSSSCAGKDISFMVIRYRVGKNNLGQEHMTFYFNVADEAHSLRIPVEEDNEWHTVIIDLKAHVGDGTVYSGTYTYGKFNPFGNVAVADIRAATTGTGAERITNSNNQTNLFFSEVVGPYVDMSCTLGCATLEQAITFVGTDTYEWFDGENIVVKDSATHQVVAD